ncbi:MAG TPA: hypothetical protein VF923_03490, partial [Gemmatimonadales bacterium]
PAGTYVSRIEPSHFDTATFYVTFDNHRNNDFNPYVYVTTDYGKTFTALAHNLPTGGPDYVHVVREDPTNHNLLYLGTDVGAYVSRDRGASWQRFMTGLPTVPVHDLKIHPREHELIAATHGRAIWIVDVAPLQQIGDSVLTASAWLFQPKTAYEYGEPTRGNFSAGHKYFRAPSPPYGAEIVYRLTTGDRRTPVKVVITDVKGDTVRTLNGPGGPGIQRVTWNFAGKTPVPQPLSPSQKRDSTWIVARIGFVFDSLAKAGMDTTRLNPIRASLVKGDVQGLAQRFGFGGGGGGGGGGGAALAGRFAERPGETTPRAQPAGGLTLPASESGGEGADAPDPTFLGTLGQLLRPPSQRAGGGGGGGGFGGLAFIAQAFGRAGGGGGGGGGFGGGGAPPVLSGDYLVSITVGGKTLSRVLRVEQLPGANAGGFAFGEDDDDNP